MLLINISIWAEIGEINIFQQQFISKINDDLPLVLYKGSMQ